MYQNEKQSQKNLKAMTVSFLLIIFVILIFFIRPNFFNKKNETALPNKTASSEEQPNPNNYSSLSSDELLEKVNAGDQLEIIDLRNIEDFAKEHLINSKNFSLQNMGDNVNSWDRDKEYVVVDDLGLTSQEIEAIKFLSDNGFFNVSYLEGGFSQWKNSLNPTINQGDPYSFSDQSKVSYIKSDDLKKIMAEENSLYIIDLRKNGQFKEGHLKGSVNIFLDDLENRYKEIPLGKKIILCDNDGMWAFQGAVRLFDLGIMNVYALSDGLNIWKQKGYEIVK